MPKWTKCNCIIKKDFSTCNSCNKTYHPGCARKYLGSKSARGWCLATLSNSYQRSSLTMMTEPVTKRSTKWTVVCGPTPRHRFFHFRASWLCRNNICRQRQIRGRARPLCRTNISRQRQFRRACPQCCNSICRQQHCRMKCHYLIIWIATPRCLVCTNLFFCAHEGIRNKAKLGR